jgi:hypothetical protein
MPSRRRRWEQFTIIIIIIIMMMMMMVTTMVVVVVLVPTSALAINRGGYLVDSSGSHPVVTLWSPSGHQGVCGDWRVETIREKSRSNGEISNLEGNVDACSWTLHDRESANVYITVLTGTTKPAPCSILSGEYLRPPGPACCSSRFRHCVSYD